MPRPASQKQHRRVRADHATELAEDYVEAIAEICRANGVCRGADLAVRFGVSHVTVNRTLGRLHRDGYVVTVPYAPVTLTPRGKKLAEAAARRHAVVLEFLTVLGVSPATAAIDTEGIEHHCSPETLRCMEEFVSRQRATGAAE